MKYGYARVSTVYQDTALQRDAFKRFGVSKVIEERRSGAAARPLLAELIARLKPGDVLCVYKVDRLARSLVDLLKILQRVTEAGASFQSLTEPIETATPVGRMMLQLLGAVAEFERAVIRERCLAGRIAAVNRGVVFGRPVQVDRKAVLEARARGLKWCEVAEFFQMNKQHLQRIGAGKRVCDGSPSLFVRHA